MIFCDISKAFDRVWHRGLLFKLQSVGIYGLLFQQFTDYLHNRKQQVVLPGTNSDWAAVNSGVPQGSILFLLLYPRHTRYAMGVYSFRLFCVCVCVCLCVSVNSFRVRSITLKPLDIFS